MMTSPGWGAAIGCAVLLMVVNSVFWMFISQLASGAKRNRTSGIRLPSLMKSDEAWHAGHVAAKSVMVPFLVAAISVAVLSIPLQLVPSAYIAALSLSLLCSVLSLLVGSVLATRAAKRTGTTPDQFG